MEWKDDVLSLLPLRVYKKLHLYNVHLYLYYYLRGLPYLDSSILMPKIPSLYLLTSFQLTGINM